MPASFSMRLTLARRLGLGFGTLLLMLLVVAGLSVVELRSQGRQVQDIVGVKNEKLALANSMLESINSMAIQARTVTLLTDVKAIDVEMKALGEARSRYANGEKALLCRLQGAGGAVEQARTQALLHLPDQHADGRLRHKQLLGGGTEFAELVDRHESAQLAHRRCEGVIHESKS